MSNSYLLNFFQEHMFQLVGAPLVENCLSGFNSSVFAYGQVVFVFFFLRSLFRVPFLRL